MCDIILFGGTTEGRLLAEFLYASEISSLVCVATPYGDSLLGLTAPVSINTGRMTESEMCLLFHREQPRLVLDATHPYADAVSRNIRSACIAESCRYERIHRKSICTDGCVSFDTMDDLVAWLNGTPGMIFSAMGAKEADGLCHVNGYQERVFLRILPSPENLAHCLMLGYPAKHLCCMQGPFSEDFNRAQFQHIGADILITKESGLHGGFIEKVSAAKQCGMRVAVLKRPEDVDGISLQKAKELILEICK